MLVPKDVQDAKPKATGMTISVFGASGYIGSALVPYLLSLGHRVVAVDWRFPPGALRDACRYGHRLHIAKGDCRDSSVVGAYARSADAIFWLVGATGDRPFQELYEVNVATAKTLAGVVLGNQRIVFPNTNAGYVSENGLVTEDSKMVGRTDYAKTKIEAESILMNTGRCVSFRLAAVYGPAPVVRWETLLNHMVMHAVAKPEESYRVYQPYAVRDVLFASDLVRRMVTALDADLSGAYNLSGESMTKFDMLCEVFARVSVRDSRRRTWDIVEGGDPDQRNFKVSEEKFRRKYDEIYGQPPFTTSLHDGIEATINAAKMEAL